MYPWPRAEINRAWRILKPLQASLASTGYRPHVTEPQDQSEMDKNIHGRGFEQVNGIRTWWASLCLGRIIYKNSIQRSQKQLGLSESHPLRCSVFLYFNKLFCLPLTPCPGSSFLEWPWARTDELKIGISKKGKRKKNPNHKQQICSKSKQNTVMVPPEQGCSWRSF
jgi:hypothetical protein